MVEPASMRPSSGDLFAHVEPALEAGVEPAKVIREIVVHLGLEAAAARRLVDSASARLWLAEGVPLADVITMLEVRRRFELSAHAARVYATEIVWAVRQDFETTTHPPIQYSKETRNAIA